MPNHTTCSKCGCVYEAGSEEQANEQPRWCLSCRICTDCEERGKPVGVCRAGHGPLCYPCIKSHDQRHAETVKMNVKDLKARHDPEGGE